ncbi:MAG: KpsF/GutQ family sugar-phosphate isomerase [Phycisphaerales bacterium]|nr:KpsF/GutQ family sugar-phosphate isomerase [Phycisphaerales bacterium]MCB9836660.1 KpsF/GutQ family sugar-phosphate isomerase [Phycisphaera sp.]
MTEPSKELELARSVLTDEARALDHAATLIDERFCEAVELIARCAQKDGTVLVSGLGKSGLIGAKISATLASLGVPSHPVHPTEATHGDLGRFRRQDVVIALSKSGETEEVVNLAAILRQDGLPVISITSGGDEPSSLERVSSVALTIGVGREAGDMPAPTSSTTATLALGDALAIAAARRIRFTDADFAKRHPGGSLGGLLRPVMDVVRFRAGENLPLIDDHLSVGDALKEAENHTGRRPGAMLLVEKASGKLTGIFTDGDLRRLVLGKGGSLDTPIAEVMTKSPRTMRDDAIIRDALTLFREKRQDEIPVVDAQGRPAGLLDVQDLIALKLVRD